MYIITSKHDNSLIELGNGLIYLDNGYPCLIDKNISFIPSEIVINETADVPQGVEPVKYCYTEAEGFYPNPNWHEPSAYDLAPQDVVDAIIDEYTNELIEQGVIA